MEWHCAKYAVVKQWEEMDKRAKRLFEQFTEILTGLSESLLELRRNISLIRDTNSAVAVDANGNVEEHISSKTSRCINVSIVCGNTNPGTTSNYSTNFSFHVTFVFLVVGS